MRCVLCLSFSFFVLFFYAMAFSFVEYLSFRLFLQHVCFFPRHFPVFFLFGNRLSVLVSQPDKTSLSFILSPSPLFILDQFFLCRACQIYLKFIHVSCSLALHFKRTFSLLPTLSLSLSISLLHIRIHSDVYVRANLGLVEIRTRVSTGDAHDTSRALDIRTIHIYTHIQRKRGDVHEGRPNPFRDLRRRSWCRRVKLYVSKSPSRKLCCDSRNKLVLDFFPQWLCKSYLYDD